MVWHFRNRFRTFIAFSANCQNWCIWHNWTSCFLFCNTYFHDSKQKCKPRVAKNCAVYSFFSSIWAYLLGFSIHKNLMLFQENEPIIFDLPDADIAYYPNFFDNQKSNELFDKLKSDIPWQQDKITVYGKQYEQPRLTALYGNEGKPYGYSNIVMQPHNWSPLMIYIKESVEAICQEIFTTVLLNRYRNGRDSNGWHADNEKELGRNPVIASVSFGAERVFQLKHNNLKDMKQNIILEHGSLLLMKGITQHFWKHQIPKTAKPVSERINLTFRIIK